MPNEREPVPRAREEPNAENAPPGSGAAEPSRTQDGAASDGQVEQVESAKLRGPLAPAEGTPEGGPEAEATSSAEEPEKEERKLLVVGIGASAGGFEALGELITNVPVHSMAFIVVQHLAPHHESALPQLLARGGTRLKVVTATDGMPIEAGHVYVIPPNANLALMHGVIRLMIPPAAHVPRLPIDFTFRSLADDVGPAAIGIVLSGTGTDGTFGLKAIKAAGGLTFVQEPSTARYDGMPRSALASGAADFCLDPKKIGEELERIVRQPRLPRQPAAAAPDSIYQDQLAKLFVLIRSESGNDLTHYKQSTIDRRIERRMTLHRFGRLEDYVSFVQSNPSELRALYKDMLITVTSFFRDPEAFEALKSQVLPRLFENKDPNRPLRVWVPACATGEEAYSIAMCLLEFCEEHARDAKIQIFGTDVDDDAIQHARRGVYAANLALDVSHERLNRFFVKEDNEYLISRTVRDLVVFSAHNVLKDAPFSRIDLVSSRNLLIYLQPPAQKKVLRVLHYALNPGGYLLLGSSETVGDAPELFSAVDRKYKIYVKKPSVVQTTLDVAFGVPTPLETHPPLPSVRPTLNLQGLADRKVLDLYGPPGAVINEDLEILQFRGHSGRYLDPAPGAASWNLLRLVRMDFHVELKRALQKARSEQQRVTTEVTYTENGKQNTVKLDVSPLSDPDTNAHCYLVLFQEMSPPKEVPVLPGPEGLTGAENLLPLAQRIQDLERELAITKEYLQTTIEEKESTLEELKSANEELQSSNEELQSTNEELETSKEEMQSTNEELTTVNEELHNRMAELSVTNDDLHNVLAGVDNPVVIVGMDLKIRRYTAAAEKLFNLVPGDIGRSIDFLGTFFGAGALEPRLSSVIQSLSTLDEEVRASNQRWYALRISPYKTLDHSIRGALITVVDIDIRKRAQEMTRDVGAYAARFLGAISQPLLILDRKLRVVWCNEPFLRAFQLSIDETVGSLLPNICAGQFNQPRLLDRLDEVFGSGNVLRDYPLKLTFPEMGERSVRVGGSQVPAGGETPLVLVSVEQADGASGRGGT